MRNDIEHLLGHFICIYRIQTKSHVAEHDYNKTTTLIQKNSSKDK